MVRVVCVTIVRPILPPRIRYLRLDNTVCVSSRLGDFSIARVNPNVRLVAVVDKVRFLHRELRHIIRLHGCRIVQHCRVLVYGFQFALGVAVHRLAHHRAFEQTATIVYLLPLLGLRCEVACRVTLGELLPHPNQQGIACVLPPSTAPIRATELSETILHNPFTLAFYLCHPCPPSCQFSYPCCPCRCYRLSTS